MSGIGTKAETGAEVPPVDTEAADHPTQAEIAAVMAATAGAHPTEIAAEVTTAAVTGAQAAVNAAAMEIPEAAIEEVSAAEAADPQPPEGTPVTASTEEINLLLFFELVLV